MNMSIPAFHVSDDSEVTGSGDVFIASRKDAVSSGVFSVRVSAKFHPPVDPYPTGTLTIKADLSDGLRTTFSATSIELMNSHGKHNPTVFMTGRCTAQPGVDQKGLRYWLMVANNKASTDAQGTPDVASFAVHDNTGARVAYGTGPLKSGDLKVLPK